MIKALLRLKHLNESKTQSLQRVKDPGDVWRFF